MRTFLKWTGLTILVLLLAFVVFFFWASASVYDESAYMQVRTYDAVPLSALPDTLSVATYNIGYLSGMTNNLPIRESEDFYRANLHAARALIAEMDADITGFQEIDFGSRRSYDYQQMDSLTQAGGYSTGAMAVNWDVRYVPFPYGLPRVNFGRILSGQAILSRLPIQHQDRVVLEMPPNPFWYNAFYLDRLAQIVYVDTNPRLAVINVHLEAFHRETRERQAHALLSIVDSLANSHAVLLIGDFNAIPDRFYDPDHVDPAESAERAGEQTMALLEGHEVLEAAYDIEASAGEAGGTYPADQPRILIDHVLYDGRYFDAVEVRILDAPGPPSDHRPVVARLVRRDTTAAPAAP